MDAFDRVDAKRARGPQKDGATDGGQATTIRAATQFGSSPTLSRRATGLGLRPKASAGESRRALSQPASAAGQWRFADSDALPVFEILFLFASL